MPGLRDQGFEDIQVVNRHDYFALSPSAQTREVAASYEALLAVAILGILGINLVLNPALWAGTIAVFALVAGVAIVTGRKRHGGLAPALLAGVSMGLLFFSLFVHYWWVSELAGFILLLGAAGWDIVLRRRTEAQHLGLRN